MDLYLHVRVLLSMILGLGVAHLLRGVARIVQHPKKFALYWVHLVWALFLFLYLIHFWWWEFSLQKITQWTFPLYFFIAIYATLLYLLCTFFFPDEMDDYDGFKNYFYRRRQWIFALMTALFIADIIDTLIKGSEYHARLGPLYDVRTGSFLILCALATKIKNQHFHAVFAVFALVFEVILILKLYSTVH